jgi:hypothetical protein
MTSQSPRIYIYKITFEEVLYYYYGVHKEKKFNEYYMGSPVTHKWMWDFYTPKKQILQFFDFTDEGWLEARKVETRLIRPFYNTDKWCLNESCMGIYSLKQASKAGKIGGNKNKELGLGVCGLSFEERSKNGKISGKIGGKNSSAKQKELGIGIYSFTFEKRSEIGKIAGKVGGEKARKLKLGFHSYTTEERKEIGRKTYEQGKGCFSLTPEERSEVTRKVNNQRWECCETGYVSTAAGVVAYQKNRKIDTSKSNRRRIS